MTDARGELPHEVVTTRASTSPTTYSEQTVILSKPTEPSATSVLYLRVSTKEQAEMGGAAEGFSIPAQREAALRKAEALDSSVVAEFVDRGESARSANRPELQKLLKFVANNRVDYVIVHKVDRLARNRVDDVEINLALQAAGVRLVSVTENIDETPSGMLLHGIMSSIAEFYSRNLANEVIKGSTQKAKNGGTVGRAPIGYVNVRRIVDGREVRTVELDPDRAPLMRWALTEFAAGGWTTRSMLEALTAKGLKSRGTRTAPGQPLAHSHFSRLLRSPYYAGLVTYRGVTYPGTHEPLITWETFEQIQVTLDDRRNGEKQRSHPHYLKSSVRCGHCGSRLIVSHNRGKSGTVYRYFMCSARHEKRNDCTLPAVPIDTVEQQILVEYRALELSPERCDEIRAALRQLIARRATTTRWELQHHRQRKLDLEKESKKLLEAHYADAVPLELLKTEQRRIQEELGVVTTQIARSEVHAQEIEDCLERALALVGDLAGAYRDAPNQVRRRFNQSLFTAFDVFDDGSVTSLPVQALAVLVDEHLMEEIDQLLRTDAQDEARTSREDAGSGDPTQHMAECLREVQMVGAEGLEPPTSAL